MKIVVVTIFLPGIYLWWTCFAAYHLCQKVVENGVNVDVITTNLNGKEKLNVVIIFTSQSWF